MAIGRQVAKGDIDNACADVLSRTFALMQDIKELSGYMSRTVDQTLIDMGYAAGEVAVIKSAISSAAALVDVWEGTAAVSQADRRKWAYQLIGIGV